MFCAASPDKNHSHDLATLDQGDQRLRARAKEIKVQSVKGGAFA